MTNEGNNYNHVLIIISTRHFTCYIQLHDQVWVQVCKQEPMGLLYKRTMNPFQSFFTFSYEIFFESNLLQLVIKNTYSCLNKSHVLCQSLLNKFNFLKVYNFCQILHFILQIYHNFESYQNMLTTLGFFFKIL